MDYRFTAILIVMLCALTICAKPIKNPSLTNDKENIILPKQKPKND
tara:strand:+ start:150 stop:287 length:138 start_codon:yes stop_codon:yes gene_type:complete